MAPGRPASTERAITGPGGSTAQRLASVDKSQLSEKITFSKLRNANRMLETVQRIETLDGAKYDSIAKTVKDGVLIVTGEREAVP